MKKEPKLLLGKAIDSMALSVEHFNGLSDTGRVEAVLILLDHSLELLLKAAILHRGGAIRDRNAPQTIGFDACVRRALSDGHIRFLTEEQALTLQAINGLRDAAQHHLIEISEPHLYLHAQAGLTLFGDIIKKVFGRNLREWLPDRALPLATVPLKDIDLLYADEIAAVRELLQPGRRRRTEALARLRPLAVVDATIQGTKLQPSEVHLSAVALRVAAGTSWEAIFPGVAAIQFTTDPSGLAIQLRLSKRDGAPVHLVPEDAPSASVVGVKRVNELDFYNLGRDQLAKHLGLTGPKTTAVIRMLDLQDDPDCYKSIQIGNSRFDRYAGQKAIPLVKAALAKKSADEYWREYQQRRRRKADKAAPR